MRCNGIFISVLLFVCTGILAQPLEVVSSSGGTFQNGSMFVSFTIGEGFTGAHHNTGVILTQGFHQAVVAKLSRGVPVIDDYLSALSVYPNPVSDRLYIRTGDLPGLYYELCDIRGKVIALGRLEGEGSHISFSALQPAVYLLKILNEKNECKVFQIVKN